VKSVLKAMSVLAAAALLSGCAVLNQAGAAAVVGDQKLTLDQVSAQTHNILAATDPQQTPLAPADANREVIMGFVTSAIVQNVADKLGVAVSDKDIRAARQQLIAKYGEAGLNAVAAASGVAPENIDRTLATSANYANIGRALKPTGTPSEQAGAASNALIKASHDLGVSIASRFGGWDANTLTITNASDGLSISVAQLASMVPDASNAP